MLHLGTYNGNPLVMAAARAVLARDLHAGGDRRGRSARNRRLVDGGRQRSSPTPACRPTRSQFGAKGCVTWSPTPVRNYRDYKATDFDLAFAQWIYGINRGILLPPGLDEQWLVSVQHTDADVEHHTQVYSDFVSALVA